jgi:hypothetical protein
MQVVHADNVERRRGLEHRGGTFHSRTLLLGEPGSPGNFKLSLSENGTDHFGPRHRHNFDQFRYMVSGVADFAADGVLRPGVLGYFPEGAFYGPQTNLEPTFVVVLQFGGASGSGYMAPSEIRAGMAELAKSGEFREGLYWRNAAPDAGVDPYQAVWELTNRRELVFPQPRYEAPVLANAAHSGWMRVGPGVRRKLFGVFTERSASASLLRLEPDAGVELVGRGLWTILEGSGSIGAEPVGKFSAVYLDAGERARLSCAAAAEILHFGLPDLSDLPAPAAVSPKETDV